MLGEYPVTQTTQKFAELQEVQLVMLQDTQVFALKTKNPVVQLLQVVEVSADRQLAIVLLMHSPKELGKNPLEQLEQKEFWVHVKQF